jgi:hypothetical protein
MSFELEIKRLYVPGVVLSGTCPKCEKVNNVDLGNQYLSYPKVDEPHDYGFYCEGCGHEWNRKIMVTLKVELLPEVSHRERETLPD